MDYGTLSTIYLICGFVFGAWFTYQRFQGGENSEFYQQMRKRCPDVDAMSPWVLFAAVALGVVISAVIFAIVWPYELVVNLLAMRRSRHNAAPLYLHPQLAKLRAQLTGHEDQYEEILTKFGLEAAVTALHAIDLPAVVKHGLGSIARRKALPKRPKAADYEDATYANVIKVAIGYTELMALDASRNRAKLSRAMEIGNDLEKRFEHIWNPGMNIGLLIVFRIHGWAPMAGLTLMKEKYSMHLKRGFNNADHMAAIFGGIQVTDERDVTRVAVKGSDLSGEEYDEMVEEHLARKPGSRQRRNPATALRTNRPGVHTRNR